MRRLVIGDVHGALKALRQVLDRAEVQPDDFLIFLGDYADGWSQTPEVLDFLIDYQEEHRCLYLRGNHDALCEEFLSGTAMEDVWRLHGGAATERAYRNVDEQRKERHIRFLRSLENYYLDEENRLFVHAGFTNLRGIAFEHFSKMFYWDRTLWELAQAVRLSEDDVHYPSRLRLYKEIFIGHTPTTRLGSDKPLSFNGVTNVDTGAAFRGRITVYDIDTRAYWQSDPVYSLYPEEKGRNV